MASPDQGLTPATVSDHFMQAAVIELRAAVAVLTEIKDVLVRSLEPKPLDLRTDTEIRVKEPVAKRK